MARREPGRLAAAGSKSAGQAAWFHDPDATTRSIPRRSDDALPFDPARMPLDTAVMLDTNVYIARIAGRVPELVETFVASRQVLHCGVALAELSITAGLLDPADKRTAFYRDPLRRLLGSISLANCRAPGPGSWVEAGMLSGILARTQLGLANPRRGLSPAEACCQEGRRHKVLNDALIFLTAGEQGAILVSSNIVDMDLLSRFRPDVEMLLFRQTGPVVGPLG